MRMAGRTAVVTGGESSIRAAIVARFHAEGGTVVSSVDGGFAAAGIMPAKGAIMG
jgi:NAD(P)-dependent dehydrogenase (short-subunit alcohol dehydrogenase family)